ncbi:MAG: flagellar assembly protein FliW [Lachnospiraceae bacterium]|nr:flagellar assembly protein FliW [Lachnospiraceae bacterium]MDD7379211.1 flagellar assembly protein FliW [Lachnospiraceae bacterium]MDY4616711.1 flagellar assembly protein FliW [Lachnospiraceae bacterium]MDY5775707.1 flagellar assembly protein FliW [Lachnospiraceae bacterium]
MKLTTRVFGEIDIEDEKIINFEDGIIGFPDLKKFTLIYDEEKENNSNIIWMQSLDEPAFAMPVMNPLLVKENYNPIVEDELLKALGNLAEENTLVLVTVTVPQNIEKTSVNLKAPIVINAKEKKAVQVIVEDEDVKYEIYDILQAQKEKAGE